jgi:serine/threonine protein kinase
MPSCHLCFLCARCAPLPRSILQPVPTPLLSILDEPDEELAAFLTFLLTIDPVRRPSAAEALTHPFLARAAKVERYVLPAEARRPQPASQPSPAV